MIEQIKKLNLNKETLILENELLKKHTTFGIGGPARILILPKSNEDIIKLINFSRKNKIDISFIGSGSNILASDEGFDGIIITLKKALNKIKFNNTNVYVQAGAMLGTMVKKAISKGYKGYESLVGVPGTVGGALIMNAGAHGTEISELLISARTLDEYGKINSFNKKDISFSYRNSSFPENEILLDAKFEINKGEKNTIIKKKNDVSKKRKMTQPLKYRSAGSIFKNPENNFAAGYLIDQAGLKGLRIGDAEVSKKHANFIINHGNAKSNEIYKLIKIIQNKVSQEFDVVLKLEIKLIGKIQ